MIFWHIAVVWRSRVAPKAGHAAWCRPGQRAQKQRVQIGQVDRPGSSGQFRLDQIRVRAVFLSLVLESVLIH